MANVVTVISWAEVSGRRMARHGLTSSLASIPDAAAAMCGTHAQVMTAAELSLGLRVADTTRSDVAAALWDERSIVKTVGLRGTLHLFRTEDLPWWLAAFEALPRPVNHAPDVRLGAAELDAVLSAIDAAVEERELTIDELDVQVAARCGDWAAERVMPAFGGFWPRWRQAIGAAACRGVLCFGPNRGRRVTYTSLKRWLPTSGRVDSDAAMRTLVHAYLFAYGPARPEHLAQWLAIPTPLARSLFAIVDLDEVEVDGATAYVNRGDTAFDDQVPPVRLLPYFDAFAVGSQPRSMLFPGRAGERALARTQAGNYPVVLVDGVVAGVWHQKRSGRRVAVTVEPLGRLSASRRRAVEAEVERLGTIVEGRAELTIGTLTVGPHA
jgi:Winged helix DNA-binding domain